MKQTLLALGVAAATYAQFIEPRRLMVTHPTIEIGRLGGRFDGYRIAQISDIHMGSGMNRARLTRIVQRVNALAPDLIAVTGDFITHRVRWNPNDLTAALQHLQAPDGVVAVPGNHDYKETGAIDIVRGVMRDCGMTDLSNRFTTLQRGVDRLYIAGVDDVAARRARLDLVLHDLPDDGNPVILLAHEPDFADLAAATGRFDLQLSGHTHGGQIRVPFLTRLMMPTYGRRYPRGLGFVDGMPAYVNQGLGMVGLRMRFRCVPEITLLTLRVQTPA